MSWTFKIDILSWQIENEWDICYNSPYLNRKYLYIYICIYTTTTTTTTTTDGKNDWERTSIRLSIERKLGRKLKVMDAAIDCTVHYVLIFMFNTFRSGAFSNRSVGGKQRNTPEWSWQFYMKRNGCVSLYSRIAVKLLA